MWTKNHRFRCAVWCIYLRRVDFLCMNIDWNFDEKASIVAWFLLLLPSACWFFRIKNYVNFMYGFGNLKLRFRKFWKFNKTTKMNANSYFIFRRFGDGENRFWSKTNAFSYFIFFRNLKMRVRHASCRNFRKNSYLGIQIKINGIKKVIISENSEK